MGSGTQGTGESYARIDEEFQWMMAGVRQGDPEAERVLVDKYAGHVLRVIRRRMSRQVRCFNDSIDFSQHLWMSFFSQRADLPQFRNEQELTRYRCGSSKTTWPTPSGSCIRASGT